MESKTYSIGYGLGNDYTPDEFLNMMSEEVQKQKDVSASDILITVPSQFLGQYRKDHGHTTDNIIFNFTGIMKSGIYYEDVSVFYFLKDGTPVNYGKVKVNCGDR